MRKAIFFGALLISFTSYSQQKTDVIQQAMRDELDRNMRDLKADGFDKPFFINYAIVDQTVTDIIAVLGALVSSSEFHLRDPESTRILVGDYEFNDESLEDNLFSRPTGADISMPIDDDYMGIRRSLWVSTDNLYRTASQQFSKNKDILKEQNRPLSEIPHRRFAKVPPSHVMIDAPEMKFDKAATEQYIRKLSAVFAAYTDLEASGVSFSYRRGYRYQANSEGAMNKIPFNLVIINVFASFRTSDGEFITENKNYYLPTTELPPFEKIQQDIKAVAETIIAASKASKLQEEYIGPVLFLDADVAATFWNQFLSFESGLRHDNNIPPLKGFSFEPQSGIETKIGKSIFAEGMTVKALPKLKKYNDKLLLGSYEVDREGVIPEDEIVLIENGVLRSLMNDRTLTKPNQTANGLSTGPGVLSIAFKTTTPRADMKAKLIAEAKKQGLDYALMTRNIGDGMRGGTINVYRVYVDDGREELVRQATMDVLSRRDFRKILAASKETMVHNFLANEREYTTIICPEAILVEEVEFKPSEFPTYKEEVYVPSPLKK